MTPLSYWSWNEVVCVRTLMGCEEPSCRNQFWTLTPSALPENAGTDPGLCSVDLLAHPIAGARILSSNSSEVTPPSKAISLRVLMVHTPQEDSQLLGWIDDSEAESSCRCSRGPEFGSQCIGAHSSCHSSLMDLMFSSGFVSTTW